MNEVRQPLSNVQLEILKAFSHNLTDEELKNFKDTREYYGWFCRGMKKGCSLSIVYDDNRQDNEQPRPI